MEDPPKFSNPFRDAQSDDVLWEGWLNRYAGSGASAANIQQSFRLARCVLRNGSLNIYRPPTELGIKSFDPSLTSSPSPEAGIVTGRSNSVASHYTTSSSTQVPSSLSGASNHKRVISASTSMATIPSFHSQVPASAPSTSQQHPQPTNGPVIITYRGLEPHPDLDYDGRGRVIGGSDEAICHTMLFGDSEDFARTAVLLLPLLTDIVAAFEIMAEYANGPELYRTSSHITSALVSRLKLVVNTVQQNFSGMLLDPVIFPALLQLIESISHHDDGVCTELKMSVLQKQALMTDILSYNSHQTLFEQPTVWSAQERPAEQFSDAVNHFLAKVEHMTTTTATSHSSGHHNNSLPLPPTLGISPIATTNSTTSSLHSNHLTPSASASTIGNASQFHHHNHHHQHQNISKPSIASIPAEVFLEMPTDTLSSQIYYFHLAFARDWSPTSDISLLFVTKYTYQRHSPLVFDSTNIHFLGALLLDHLFKHKNVNNVYRGRLITHWINLGNALKGCGDMVGWLAIATVLCSIPVMRLKDTWGHVSPELRDRVVKEWAPVVFDLERRLMIADMSRKSTYHVLAPQGIGMTYPKERVVPFFGDLCVKYEVGSSYKQCEGRLNRIRTAFDRWQSYLEQIPQNDTFDNPPEPIPSMQKLLYALLAHHYETPVISPETVLRMSLKVEPAGLGNYLKYHDTQRYPLSTGAYMPLLFTDVNSSYKLFSKPALISASGVSSGSSKRSIRGTRDNNRGLGLNFMSSSSGNGHNGNDHNNMGPSPSMYGLSSIIHGSSTSLGQSSVQSSASAGNLQRSNSYPPTANRVPTTTGVKEVDFSGQRFVSRHESRHDLIRTIRDFLNVDTVMYCAGDEIILKSFDTSKSHSRPSSVIEAPSKRNSSSSRPLSAQFQQSSNANNGENGNPPYDYSSMSKALDSLAKVNVVVKAASVERLVDILVLGVNDFRPYLDDNESSPTPSSLKIDMDVNTLTFFSTFRSFCSPIRLLELLSNRFLGARSAAVSLVNNKTTSQDLRSFPDWETHCDEPIECIDWKLVAQIQVGVLEACHLWISQFFSDFLNDLAVRDQFLELLKNFEAEFDTWHSVAALKEDYKGYLKSIESLHKKVRKLFIKKSYRPNDINIKLPAIAPGVRPEPLPVVGANLTRLESFVEDIDHIMSDYYSLIRHNDWMELFELLEVQGADLLGFFSYRPRHFSGEEDVVIQDIYSYLNSLHRPSAPEDKLVDHFPPVLRELFNIHANVVNYVTSQIADPTIRKDDRVGRMVTVLKALGIMKARMKKVDLFPSVTSPSSSSPANSNGAPSASPGSPSSFNFISNSGISTNVPGFLESAFVAAILRPESRTFANSWLQASKEVSHHFELNYGGMSSLESSIPVIADDDLRLDASQRAMTPCIGWIVERMLEIVCYVPNMSVENPRLINFDKRRYVYNLITNITAMANSSAGVGWLSDNAAGGGTADDQALSRYKRMAYLIHPDKSLYVLERKTIKDCATRELKEYPRGSAKTRVFQPLPSFEMDKLKRDNRQLDALERQVKELRKQQQQNLRHKSVSSYNLSAVAPGGPGGGGSVGGSIGGTVGPGIQERKASRSRFGGLLKAVRPISMAFSGGFSGVPADKVVAPQDLPDLAANIGGDVSRLKLLASIPMVQSEFTKKDNCMFLVHNGADNSDNLFQAISEEQAEECLQQLEAVKKKEIYKEQMSPTSTKVFGVPIQVVCEREKRDIPKVVDVLLTEVEARGLEEVGLYRIPGSLASVNALKNAFDTSTDVDMEDDRWYDINTVAGCFKLYLRELPEPLLTSHLFSEFVACGTNGLKVRQLKECVQKLPAPNYNLLKRVSDHLVRVTDKGDINRMHAVNLAIVFSMSFLPSSSATSSVSSDLGAMQNILKALITKHGQIFGDEPIEETADMSSSHSNQSLAPSHHSVSPTRINDYQLVGDDQEFNSRRAKRQSRIILDTSIIPDLSDDNKNSSPSPVGEEESSSKRNSYAEVSAY